MTDAGKTAERELIDDELLKFIDDISAEMRRKDLALVKLRTDDVTVKVENRTEVQGTTMSPLSFVPPPGLSGPALRPAAGGTTEANAEKGDYVEVISPITGTFYAASAPKEPPFVKQGDTVKVGMVLCIVEAMKVMNKVASKHDGTVHSIEVTSGDVVQTGQVIMKIAPAS